MTNFGQIIILNGVPRSGKSSIVQAMQNGADDLWINLGVDVSVLAMTPERFRPGIGLRPGGEMPELEPIIVKLYAALYESIAAHSRVGINVIAEFGHHDCYSQPLGILSDCGQRLEGLPVLFVGVRCSIEEIMRRRNAGQAGRPTQYETSIKDQLIPSPVQRFQDEVHKPGRYDLEVDTTHMSAEDCVGIIRQRLIQGDPGTAIFESGLLLL